MTHLDTNILFFCLLGFLLSLFLGLAVPAFGRRTALVDRSEIDAQGRPISRAGGTAMFLAWSVTLSLAGQLQGDLLLMIGCIGGAWLIGLHDDFVDSSPRFRLLGLSALAVIAASQGFAPDRVVFPGGVELGLGGAAVPLAALWILGTTVAFNFIDGLDGLALSLGALASACCVLAGAQGVLALAALSLAAVQVGLLAWNRPPASFYLGDNGSNALGFALGCLSIGSLRAAEAFPVLTGLLLIGVPVADAATTMLRRARGAGSLFQSDLHHLHHRALRARGGEMGALAQLGLIALAGAVLGLGLLFID